MKKFFGLIGGRLAAFFEALRRFSKRRKKLSIFLLALVLAAASALIVLPRVFGQQQTAEYTGMPETAALSKMDLSLTVTATGTLQSTETKEVSSSLAYDIKEVYVSVGDTVESGQPLCLLDDTDLEETIAGLREDIAETAADHEEQLSRLASALQDATNKRDSHWSANNAAADTAYKAIEQTKVSAGNKAGSTALENLAAGDAQAAANAAVINAQNNTLAVGDPLSDEGAILSDDGVTGVSLEKALANAQKKASDAQAALNNASAGAGDFETILDEFIRTQALQSAVRQMRDEVYNTAYQTEYEASKTRNHDSAFTPAYNAAYNAADTSAATAAYHKAVEARDTAYETDSKSIETARQNYDDEAERDSTETMREQLADYLEDLDELSVTSPIAGVVTAMTAEAGEGASGGDASSPSSGGALFTVESANQLEIPVSVAEYDAIGLSKGLSATVTSDAIEDMSWDAAVTEVSPKATDGYFTVTVEITSPVGDLVAGMSATVDIVTESREDVFAVPFDAVVTNDAGQTVVYVTDMRGGGGAGNFGSFSGEVPEGFELPEGFEMPADGELPEGGGMSDFGNRGGDAAAGQDTSERREIVVETGFESDYYIEISGDGLEEGLMVLIDPLGINVQSAGTTGGSEEDAGGGLGMIPGGNGGAMPGTFSGGGMPDGGAARFGG